MRFKVGDRVLYHAYVRNNLVTIECKVILTSPFTGLYRIKHSSGREYVAWEYELEAIPKTVKRSYLKSPFS